MKINNLIVAFTVYFATNIIQSQEKKYIVHTVAFYNLENFYDTINDPNTRDDEWVYTKKYFLQKQDNIAKVISQIGKSENPANSPPLS